MANRIDFYMDSRGKNSVLEYLDELSKRKDKQSRVKHEKKLLSKLIILASSVSPLACQL